MTHFRGRRCAAALVLAALLAAPAADAQWTTVHGFAPRGTLRFPFQAQGERVAFATPDSVFSSLDGGATFAGRSIRSDIDPGNALQGGGTWDGDLLVGGTCPSKCLSRSPDGRTWTRVPIPTTGASTVYGLAVGVAGRGNVLVVATVPATGSGTQTTLWRSTDGGASWGYAATASIPYAPNHLFVVGGRFFLVADAAANAYTGLLYSSSDGNTWTEARHPISGGTAPMDRVDTVVESGGSLYTSTSGGLHRSTDGGATWTHVRTNLTEGGDGYVTSLVGLGGGQLAGTHQGAHVRSSDGGATWSAMTCGLYGRGFWSDDFEAASGYLFTRAGGEIGRIAYASCGLAAPVAAESPDGAPGLRLDAPVPSPARGALTVRFALPTAGAARLAVYDALGREVAVLHDGPASGEVSAALDASPLAPGVYVARLTTASDTATRRFVVAR